jgi:hypothetical protein
MSQRPSESLTVGEFIRMLQQFPPSMPVSVSDGYEVRVYDRLSACTVERFKDHDGVDWCDIGVGGCETESP